MRARDVMVRDVVSITTGTSLADIVSLMTSRHISALPVLEGDKLVGIVTESDLMRRVETETEAKPSRWAAFFTDPSILARIYAKSHGQKAAYLMTPTVVTVQAEAPLAEVATLLASHNIKHVPVMQDGHLVGILGRATLVQALASRVQSPGPVPLADREIREQLLNGLGRQPWAASKHLYNVVIEDGIVHLWGWIGSDEERRATIVLAENVPGVQKVVDHLLPPPQLAP